MNDGEPVLCDGQSVSTTCSYHTLWPSTNPGSPVLRDISLQYNSLRYEMNDARAGCKMVDVLQFVINRQMKNNLKKIEKIAWQ
jgi:hypothetical protein